MWNPPEYVPCATTCPLLLPTSCSGLCALRVGAVVAASFATATSQWRQAGRIAEIVTSFEPGRVSRDRAGGDHQRLFGSPKASV
jgi:hypothetical protein